MQIYYYIVGLPILIRIASDLNRFHRNSRNKLTIFCFFAVYFAALAFRSENIGIDLPFYIYRFRETYSMSFLEMIAFLNGKDIGYVLFNWLVGMVIHNQQLFIILISGMIVIPTAYFYYKESKNAVLTIAIYLVLPMFFVNFSAIRQMIAVSFAIPTFYYVKDGHKGKFLATVIVAALFHASALLMLLFYPLYKIKISKQRFFSLFLPLYVFLLIFNKRVFEFIIPLIGGKYNRYDQIQETGAYGSLILYVLLACFAYIVTDERKMDADTLAMRNMLTFAIIIQCFTPIHALAMRFNYYLLIFLPILIPWIIEYRKPRYTDICRLASFVMSCSFVTIFLYKLYHGVNFMATPWKSFIS